MAKRVFTNWASKPWTFAPVALAGVVAGPVVTGCIVAKDIYGTTQIQVGYYQGGQVTADTYSSGLKTGKAGC